MNFAFSEEQEELRRAVRQFLEAKSPETEVRRLMETTDGYDPATQRRTGIRAAVYSAVLAVVVLVAGSVVLGFFSINVDDFRIAGGIVLLMIGLGMLNGTGSTVFTMPVWLLPVPTWSPDNTP